MGHIVLGCLAIGMMALFDWAMMRGFTRVKVLFFLVAILLFGFGLRGVLSSPRDFQFPTWSKAVGGVGLLASSLLLIYSIFIEIPLRTTYLRSDTIQPLVSTGTYALVRHPGLLWFGSFAISLTIIHPSRSTAIASAVWFIADIFLIVLEDVFFFPRTIRGYSEYKLTTPFILPSRASFRRFKKTILSSEAVNEHSY